MTAFGATILDASGLRLTPEERALFAQADPYGFILFARNIDTPDQVRALCQDMREAVGRDAPILIDQEGGRVQRLRGGDFLDWDDPQAFIARAGDAAEEAMFLRYALIAAEMRALGIDTDCAPLVDVAGAGTHPFLRSRCYGTEAATVARLGRAAASGLAAGGCLPVVKHIPGHGRAQADSHHELPRVRASVEALQVDFAPFQVLNDLPMAMTAHIVYDAYDPELPATLSPRMVQVIRNDIGFDNLLMTDDISMKALDAPLTETATGALAAGCDVVLLCNATLDDRRAVAETAGRMTATAQVRAEQALARRPQRAEVDIQAMQAKLSALLERGRTA